MVSHVPSASILRAEEPAPADALDSTFGVPSAATVFADLTLDDVRTILAGSADESMSRQDRASSRDRILDHSHPIGGCPPCLAAAGIEFNPTWTTRYCTLHLRELELQLALRKTGEARAAALHVLEALGETAPRTLAIERPVDDLSRLHANMIEESGKTTQ